MVHCRGEGSLKVMPSQRNLTWIHCNTALLKGMARQLLPPPPPRKWVGHKEVEQLRLLYGRGLEAVPMRGAKAHVCGVCPPLAHLHPPLAYHHPHPILENQVCACMHE